MLLRTLPYLPGKLPTAVVREAIRQDFAAFSRSLQNIVVSHRLDGAIDRLSQRRVLLIHGSKDRAAPISNVRQLVQGMPRWELVEAPDLAHNVPSKIPVSSPSWWTPTGAGLVPQKTRSIPPPSRGVMGHGVRGQPDAAWANSGLTTLA